MRCSVRLDNFVFLLVNDIINPYRGIKWIQWSERQLHLKGRVHPSSRIERIDRIDRHCIDDETKFLFSCRIQYFTNMDGFEYWCEAFKIHNFCLYDGVPKTITKGRHLNTVKFYLRPPLVNYYWLCASVVVFIFKDLNSSNASTQVTNKRNYTQRYLMCQGEIEAVLEISSGIVSFAYVCTSWFFVIHSFVQGCYPEETFDYVIYYIVDISTGETSRLPFFTVAWLCRCGYK